MVKNEGISMNEVAVLHLRRVNKFVNRLFGGVVAPTIVMTKSRLCNALGLDEDEIRTTELLNELNDFVSKINTFGYKFTVSATRKYIPDIGITITFFHFTPERAEWPFKPAKVDLTPSKIISTIITGAYRETQMKQSIMAEAWKAKQDDTVPTVTRKPKASEMPPMMFAYDRDK